MEPSLALAVALGAAVLAAGGALVAVLLARRPAPAADAQARVDAA